MEVTSKEDGSDVYASWINEDGDAIYYIVPYELSQNVIVIND